MKSLKKTSPESQVPPGLDIAPVGAKGDDSFTNQNKFYLPIRIMQEKFNKKSQDLTTIYRQLETINTRQASLPRPVPVQPHTEAVREQCGVMKKAELKILEITTYYI